MKKLLFATLLTTLIAVSAFAQEFECMGISNTNIPNPNTGRSGCTSESPQFLDFYRNKEMWIPNSTTPIKYINIATIVRQKSANDLGNFDPNNPSHMNYLDQIINLANQMLSNIPQPSDPRSNSCGNNCHIVDSRIRIREVSRIFIPNDPNYGLNNNSTANSVSPQSVMNIFYYGNSQKFINGVPQFDTDGTPLYVPGGSAGGGFVWMANQLPSLQRGRASTHGIAENIVHEIFHNYGLMHVYEPTCCHEKCDNTLLDYLSDVFGLTNNGSCWEPHLYSPTDPNSNCDPFLNPNDNCTNNFMGLRGRYFSPIQLGRLHREMMLGPMKAYQCGYGTVPFIVNRDETWDFRIAFYQDIIIKAGNTLTIKCEVEMSPGTKIIVEPNAKLIVDNAIIKGKVSNWCNGLWKGIEVWGNASQHQFTYGSNQSHQGILIVKNNAVIANAEIAVLLGRSDDPSYTNTGGIIYATNSIFYENKIDVSFLKYQNFNPIQPTNKRGNLSYFKKCNFSSDFKLIDNSNPLYHVKLWNVDGVRFYGCKFENNRQDMTSYNEVGDGIYAEDANFILTGCDWQFACIPFGSCCSKAENKFINLRYGVRAKRIAGAAYNYTVDNSKFDGCLYGIHNEGVNNPIITNNIFELGNPPLSGFYAIGLTINTGSGFRVERNSFLKQNTTNTQPVGVWASNTGMNFNQMTHNSFVNMQYGIVASGRNKANALPLSNGLAFFCNQHTGVAQNDLFVNGSSVSIDGIKPYQVGTNSSSGAGLSSGNSFSRTGTNQESDIKNTVGNVSYFYDGDPIVANPKYPAYSSLSVSRIRTNYVNTCVNSIGGLGGITAINGTRFFELVKDDGTMNDNNLIGLKQVYQTINNELLTKHNIYSTLIDGGNTSLIKDEIENSNQNEVWQLRSKLLGESPYLSKEVLLETAEKTDVLPLSIIYEILAANPDALRDESLMKELAEKYNPLPEWMIEMLRELSEEKTARTFLETSIASLEATKDQIIHLIVQDLIARSINNPDFNHAELRSWLAAYHSPVGDYQIVDDFFETGEFSSGMALMSTIPLTYDLNERAQKEYDDMLDFFTLISNTLAAGKNLRQLGREELDVLSALSENGEGIAKVRACNLISFYDGDECPMELKLPTSSSSLRYKSKNQSQNKNLLSSMTVSPNPANEYIEIDYHTPLGEAEGILQISDILGKVLYKSNLKEKFGLIAIDTRSWERGMYFAEIVSGKNSQITAKFILTK